MWAPVPSAQSKFGQLAAGLPSTSSAQAQEQATICHRLMGWLISLVGTLMGWLAGWLADAGVPGAAPGSAGGSSVSSSLRAFLGRQKTIGADAVAQQVRVRAGDAAPCWMRVLSCMAVHACSCATPPCARPLQGHTHTHTHTQTQTRAHITCECRYTRACRPPRKAPSPTARPRQHTLRRKPGAPPLSAACAATQLPPRQRRQRQRRRRVLPGCLRLFCHMRLHLLLQLRAAVVARCKVGHVVAMLGPP